MSASNMGRPRTATVVKLLTGTTQRHPELIRDETVTHPGGTPQAYPWLDLSTEEQSVFDWLVANATLKQVHARADSLLIAKLAKVIVQSMKAERKLAEFGPIMKNPRTTKPELQPYYYAVRQMNTQIRQLMSELGMTPIARLRFAPPMPTSSGPNASSWGDID